MRHRQRKDRLPRVLVHHVKADHDDLPDTVGDRACDHPVLGIVRCGLGDAEMAELALFLLPQQHRHQDVAGVVVGGGRHTMQLVDVDVVGIELAQ